jgi:hypothetical protein
MIGRGQKTLRPTCRPCRRPTSFCTIHSGGHDTTPNGSPPGRTTLAARSRRVHRRELAVFPCLSGSLPHPSEPGAGSSESDPCASNLSRHRPNKTATTGLRSCRGEAGGRELDPAGCRFPGQPEGWARPARLDEGGPRLLDPRCHPEQRKESNGPWLTRPSNRACGSPAHGLPTSRRAV